MADIRNLRAFLRPIGTALEAKRDRLGISRVDAARQIGISKDTYYALEDATAGSPHLQPVIAALDWLGLRLAAEPKQPGGQACADPRRHSRAVTAKEGRRD